MYFGTVDNKRINILEIDIMGVDILGVDILAPTQMAHRKITEN